MIDQDLSGRVLGVRTLPFRMQARFDGQDANGRFWLIAAVTNILYNVF